MNRVDVFDQLSRVAMIARKCPTPVLQTTYVKAMRDWCTQTRWLQQTVTGPTQAGVPQYSLGNDDFVEIVSIVGMSIADPALPTQPPVPVVASDSSGWPAGAPEGMPRRYAYVPEGQFALYQTPDAVYNLQIAIAVTPRDNVREVPAAPLVKYSSTFEAGALETLLAMQDTPWHDPVQSVRYGAIYRSGISNGKAEAQRNFNSGSQRVRPRPFFR